MSWRTPRENENEVSLGCLEFWISGTSFRHVSGRNPGGIRTGPPTKAFGGDGFEAFYSTELIFQGAEP